MTDRELLELAAKAAGVNLVCRPLVIDGEERDCFFNQFDDGRVGCWEPLTNDGDALRLVAKLSLHILHNDPGESVLWVSAVLNKRGLHGAVEFQDNSQRNEATRRAIVRAAAEIGKAME